VIVLVLVLVFLLDTLLFRQNGWTPLHYAIQHAHVDIVRILLREGCDSLTETQVLIFMYL
jgi:hypothetical protein